MSKKIFLSSIFKAFDLRNFPKKSFSLVELMIALGVFVLVSATIIFLVLGGQQSQKISEERAVATQLAQEAMEAVRSIRDRRWNELKVKPQPYGLNSSTIATDKEWKLMYNQPETNLLGKFTRKIFISQTEPADPDKRKITVEVSWGVFRKIQLVSYLTNWRSADATDNKKGDFETGEFEGTRLIDGDSPTIKLDDLAGSTIRANEFLIDGFTDTPEITTDTKISFRFTAQNSGTVNNLRVYLGEVSGARNYNIGLQTNSNGNPSGTWLNNTCFVIQPISSGNQWLSVTVPNCSLSADTIYHLVIEPQ